MHIVPRVLYISSFGDMRGGGQSSLLLLLKGIDKNKFKPFVMCPTDGDFVNELRSLGVMTFVFEFPSLRRFNVKAFFGTVKKLTNIIRMVNPDIVHTESSRSIGYLKYALFGTKVPIVRHAHVCDREPFLYELFMYACVTRIIAVSNAVKKRFDRFPGAENKVRVVYNAVEASFGNGAEISNAAGCRTKEHDIVRVGLVGRITPLKGHTTFIHAASLVIGRRCNVRFQIVGKGDQKYEEELQSLIKDRGMQDYVTFTGYQDDISDVMAGIDILVCPSLKEAFSMGIIEAMAHAKPVIASNVGGIPEVVEDGVTGILVPATDESSLAEAIIKLAHDRDLRERMGACGKERVSELFTLEDNVKKIQDLYAGLA
jgi:glycosyltransferase involved in cell wall biosynthesis